MSNPPSIDVSRDSAAPPQTQGFPAVARSDARILVLGSLPGRKSVEIQEYYAHPQNAFWRIMATLVGATGEYGDRCAALLANRIALWDVLHASIRPGSLDADIRLETAQPNDFNSFFMNHTGISRILFNGQKAQQMYDRFVGQTVGAPAIEHVLLPSTSPAYASMSYDDKLAHWRAGLYF